MHPFHDCTEGAQRKLRDLEVLFPEGDSNNRDAQQNTEQEVDKRQHPPAEQEPENVQKERHGFPFVINLLAEGIQRDAGQLEALHSDRKADDCDAPQAACPHPSESTHQTAEDDP